VIHPSLTSVSPGTQNVQLLRIAITTDGPNNPIHLTSLVFNAMGATSAQVSSAALYFTGTSTTFSTANPVGNTINNIQSGNNTFTLSGGGIACPQGTNYF